MVDFIKIVGIKTRWKSEIPQSDLEKYSGHHQSQLFDA